MEKRPYCPNCGGKNVEMTGLVNGFIAPGPHEQDDLDRMTYVKCKDCGWKGMRYDCEEESILLNDLYFERHGFEKVDNFGKPAWKFTPEGKDYSLLMTFNEYDNTWIYSDYRNRLYGLTTTTQFYSLLDFLEIFID